MTRDGILVTGSTGFIGSHLLDLLWKESYPVYALARRHASAAKLQAIAHATTKVMWGDVLDYPSLVVAMGKTRPAVIIHLAALVRRFSTNLSQPSWHAVNEAGVENVCRACLETKVKRLVMLSSADVHGPAAQPGPLIDEEWPYRPTDQYSESKVTAEKIALRYHLKERLDVVILRPTHVYGPGDPSFLPKLMAATESLPFIPILGDGKTLKHFVYIDDMVKAILLAMNQGTSGRAYIIADDRPVSLERLFGIMARVTSRPKRVIHILSHGQNTIGRLWHPLSWFYTNRAYRIARAKSEIGYRPLTDLESGLKRMYEDASNASRVSQ